nr:hypothetical protein GCM10020093_053160 [Planobispora longispora]
MIPASSAAWTVLIDWASSGMCPATDIGMAPSPIALTSTFPIARVLMTPILRPGAHSRSRTATRRPETAGLPARAGGGPGRWGPGPPVGEGVSGRRWPGWCP